MNLTRTSTRSRGPAEELRHRLDAACDQPPGLPTLDELTAEQDFAMVESWRQAACAATFGEHDFAAGLGYGALSRTQGMTLLKDASDITRGLVGLDRRYSNIPGWQSLKDAGRLARVAEACSAFAGHEQPDFTIDLRGWRPRPTLIDSPALDGLAGLFQAQHNLLVHLGSLPDARALRLVLDSQRIVSRDIATVASARSPVLASLWRTRAETYLRLIHVTRDIGGIVGNGGSAAREASLAASRAENLARLPGARDTHQLGALQRLAQLCRDIDERITRVIERGVSERVYFARVPLPRIDTNDRGLVKPTRHRYAPITTDVAPALLEIVRAELRPQAPSHADMKRAAASRAELTAAIVHRPEPRRTRSGLSM